MYICITMLMGRLLKHTNETFCSICGNMLLVGLSVCVCASWGGGWEDRGLCCVSGAMVQACMCLPQLGLDLGRVCSVLYNWGEPHTGSIEIFLIIYIYMCAYICRTSFCVYLSSISTICKFEQSMCMYYTLCYIEIRKGELQRHKKKAKLQR